MELLNAERDTSGCGGITPQLAPSLALFLERTSPSGTAQPVTVGLPVAPGLLRDPAVDLLDADGTRMPCQSQALAYWSDGSVRWLLLDFLAPAGSGRQQWELRLGQVSHDAARPMAVTRTEGGLLIDAGEVRFHLDTATGTLGARRAESGEEVLAPAGLCGVLTDAKGKIAACRLEQCEVEVVGPVRSTVRFEGHFCGKAPLRFVGRLGFYAGTALIRLDLTVHNPHRARHPGGLWDLGDAGSIFFRDLSLHLPLGGAGQARITWSTEPKAAVRSAEGNLEIYQDSSGGENWQGPNHVNRHGRVTCSFQGYRVRAGQQEQAGLRASPIVTAARSGHSVSVAMADFWQQFPKALEVSGQAVIVRLFPGQHGDLFELQGGEKKTHTVWLDLASRGGSTLDWVASPARARLRLESYAESGALGHLAPGPGHRPFEEQVSEVLAGPSSFFAGREVIDEYGWRHYGEVFADHEEEHYPGPGPFVSHYNNQYDIVLGLLLQFFRTGDGRWLDLAGPLARHVYDIDVYHTKRDKAAYNGGMFWFTDHYRTAHTSTHRTYSRQNCPTGQDYGGGPSSSHLFSTGLLYYHYLTGDPLARDVVVELADWVVAMDDGSQTLLGLIDPAPTGLASSTGMSSYHGPGRGCGNSVTTLLDGWLITGRRAYLDKAEELIRRSVHPDDDVASHQLLDIEKRWSYTVFLTTLARYLGLKAEAGECDMMYAYTRASLLRYASWMGENELPYFDRADQLEYPTEAWAGQELRKANVLRLAAEHAAEPLRSCLWRRGEELSDRAWKDLYRFASRTTARGQALVMTEGTRDDYFRRRPQRQMPPAPSAHFPPPEGFVPQKLRVLSRLRRPSGLAVALLCLFDPRLWQRLFASALRTVLPGK